MDYDFYFGKESKSTAVVYTDAHSLETQLWKLDVDCFMISKMLSEALDDQKSANESFQRSFYDAQQELESIYELAFDAAFKIGIFRMANEKNDWRINFKKVKLISSMFDQASEKLDMEQYIRGACLATNPNIPCSKIDEIILRVDRLLKREWDKWTIMQGHDIGSAFIWYLKRKIKILQNQCSGMDDIEGFEKLTRYVCPIDRLKDEEFYKNIKAWVNSMN